MINIINDELIIEIIKKLNFEGAMKLIIADIEYLYYFKSDDLIKLYYLFLYPHAFDVHSYMHNYYHRLECIIKNIIHYGEANNTYEYKIKHPIKGDLKIKINQTFYYNMEPDLIPGKTTKDNIFQMFIYYLYKLLLFEEDDNKHKDLNFYKSLKIGMTDLCVCYCGAHLIKKNLKNHFKSKTHENNMGKSMEGKKDLIKCLNKIIYKNESFNYGFLDDN